MNAHAWFTDLMLCRFSKVWCVVNTELAVNRGNESDTTGGGGWRGGGRKGGINERAFWSVQAG